MMSAQKMVLFLLVVVCCLSCCRTQGSVPESNSSHGGETLVVEEDNDPYLRTRRLWMDADKSLKRAMGKMMKSLTPTVMRQIYSKNISTSCLSSLMQIPTAMKKGKLWPFQMLDACGKLPEGFLTGSLSLLGDYKECLAIHVNESRVKLRGQYCSVTILPPTPKWRPFMSVHLRVPELVNVSEPDSLVTHMTGFVHNLYVTQLMMGVCLPSQCTEYDVQNIIQLIPESVGLNWEFNVRRCESWTETSFTFAQKCILYVFGVLAVLIGLGSILDFFCTAENVSQTDVKGTVFHVLRSFSFAHNARRIANHSCSDANLHFVYGAMFFSLLWVVIANTFMYVNYDVSSNILQGMTITVHMFYEIVLHRSIPIQTFFFLSGFVSAYQIMRSPETKFCAWKYVLKKYLRYTPGYIFLLMLMLLVPSWGSGPTWMDRTEPIYTKCLSKWWSNILYINNFMDQGEACLDHTWMIAVAAQLHVISIFIFIPLKSRKPSIGLMITLVLMVASLLTVALTNVYYELPPNEMMAFFGPRDRLFYAKHTYLRVYTHLCVYCMGITTGYLMVQKPKFQLSRFHTWIVGMLTVTGALATLTTVHEWRTGVMPSPVVSALYAALGKLAWAFFLSWIAITCMSGRGGVLKDVLSWRPFAFLGQLTFTAYILHPVVITIAMAFQKTHLYIEDFQILYVIVSHLGGSFLLSYICHLVFESPFLSLAQIITRTSRSRPFNCRLDYPASTSTACNGVLSEKPIKLKETDTLSQTRTKF